MARRGGRRRTALACVVAAALVVVGGGGGAQAAPGSGSLVGGEPDAEHVAVVMVSWGGTLCTGTYLGAGLVLTAAHCVPPAASGTAVSVTFVAVGADGGRATLASTRHDALPDRLGEAQDATNDLGRIFVEPEDVPADIAGMLVLDEAGALAEATGARRDQLTAVGFGATAAPAPGEAQGHGAGTRLRGKVTLEEVGEHTAQVSRRDGDAVPCDGDSGGPLVMDGDPEHLAGVVSTGNCAAWAIYTRVDTGRGAAYLASPEPVEPEAGCAACGAAGSPAGLAPVALGAASLVLRRRRRRARPRYGSGPNRTVSITMSSRSSRISTM